MGRSPARPEGGRHERSSCVSAEPKRPAAHACPLLKSPPNAAARPLEKQEAGLISKPLKIRYHSVV